MTGSTISEPRLRVALVSHDTTLGGGAELSLLELAVALQRDGRVDPVVAVPGEGPLTAALGAESVRYVVMPNPLWAPYDPAELQSAVALGGLARRARWALRVARRVRPWVEWLRAERPDVVLTSSAVTPTAALASAVVRVPHVWWLHEFVTTDHGLQYVLGEPISQRAIGWLSTLVVANSEAVRAHYSPPIPSDKMRLIYYGIAATASPNEIEPGALRLLLLGRQTPMKGQALALEAMGLLERESVNVKLRLVGEIDSSYRQELEQLASLFGVAHNLEIFDYTTSPGDHVRWANVVLMCSQNEAFGRVTVEALKSGRPVVGTRSGGTPELITDGIDGFVFEPGSAPDLAAALRRFADDPELLAAMAERARTGTRARFTTEREVDMFVDVFTSVATRTGSRSTRAARTR